MATPPDQPPSHEPSASKPSTNDVQWRDKYGSRHRLERIQTFPAGVSAPKKVRLYARRDHFIVQWWDPAAKSTLSLRVTGDLIDALTEARKIDARLVNFKTAGRSVSKLGHTEMVDRFIADLHSRADAGELAAATVLRYTTALNPYQKFCDRSENLKCFPTAVTVNREFRLAFAAHLATNSLDRGKRASSNSIMAGPVLDAVRAMFNWAGDPDRGNLLPEGFRNPFDRAERPQRQAARDPFGEPDITVAMAIEFIGACDAFQLPLFATLILYGLRAAEPLYLFSEHLDDQWFKLNCLPELDYLTKGRRDKRFPIVSPLGELLQVVVAPRKGLTFTSRPAGQKENQAPLFGVSLADLAAEFRRRCRAAGRCHPARIRARGCTPRTHRGRRGPARTARLRATGRGPDGARPCGSPVRSADPRPSPRSSSGAAAPPRTRSRPTGWALDGCRAVRPAAPAPRRVGCARGSDADGAVERPRSG